MTKRLDELIQDIRQRFHGPAFEQKNKTKQPPADEEAGDGDVLIVAHGHILRAFAMRWVGRKLTDGVSLILEGKSSGLRNYSALLAYHRSKGFADMDSSWRGWNVEVIFTYARTGRVRRIESADFVPSYEHDKIEEPAIL